MSCGFSFSETGTDLVSPLYVSVTILQNYRCQSFALRAFEDWPWPPVVVCHPHA
jgi:hypothetical protein